MAEVTAKTPINLGNRFTFVKKALEQKQQERIFKSLKMMCVSFSFFRKRKGAMRYMMLPRTDVGVSAWKTTSPVTGRVSPGPPSVRWACSFALEPHGITIQAVASSETDLVLSRSVPQGPRRESLPLAPLPWPRWHAHTSLIEDEGHRARHSCALPQKQPTARHVSELLWENSSAEASLNATLQSHELKKSWLC